MERFFVRTKESFDEKSNSLKREIETRLGISPESLTIYDVFDVETEDDIAKVKDLVITNLEEEVKDPKFDKYIAYRAFAVQYDQKADACMEILAMAGVKCEISTGTLIDFSGITDEELETIKTYIVNTVVEKEFNPFEIKKETIPQESQEKIVMEGFIDLDKEGLESFLKDEGLAMSIEDLVHIQKYFISEKRNPTETEILVLDTYWSDHCRHTTFETALTNIEIKEGRFKEEIENAFETYLDLKKETSREEKDRTLMEMATIVGRYFRQEGLLEDQEVSDEINACSIEIEVDEDGVKNPWLLMFKNETHNHPTEIEPFGGAGTCLGGCIRDPLSGRSYAYQALRLTGAGDITKPVEETLEGKLPQVKITTTAADGYSDYGKQIGSAASYIKEFYHPGFVAKRMEMGAVVAAAPRENVTREQPVAGDLILLLGGKTGRDGVGGATGSSVEQSAETAEASSSEVQKGNPTIERRIVRLYKRTEAARLIKKSNDFGAGGVSVAIGELADGLDIDLNAVKTKYEGLSATERAISESQERMAIVLDPKDLDEFLGYCIEENVDAYQVAVVTEEPRLVINFNGEKIVDLSREFLDTNGIKQSQTVIINSDEGKNNPFEENANLEVTKENILNHFSKLENNIQKGLAQKFDMTVGRSTVLMPFGGKYQLTEAPASVQKLPARGFTKTASAMGVGYIPNLASYSPFLGGLYSVIEALARLVATGTDYKGVRLTNQEFFERLDKNEEKWGKPTQALLGLVEAELAMGVPSIGGKDSMSGSFEDKVHVPPTLVTFGINTVDVDHVISPEFKEAGNKIYLVSLPMTENYHPNYKAYRENLDKVLNYMRDGKVKSANIVEGGLALALAKMSYGNMIGAKVNTSLNVFDIMPGFLILESSEDLDFEIIGETIENSLIINDVEISLEEALQASTSKYEDIYPINIENKDMEIDKNICEAKTEIEKETQEPVVLIPIFPGINNEYDLENAFKATGANVKTVVFSTDDEHFEGSVDNMAKEIESANIMAIAGSSGFGNHPLGGGKHIQVFLEIPKIKAAVEKFLEKGLLLGIDDGFKGLVLTGLLPNGEYCKNEDFAIGEGDNFYNRMVDVRVSSTMSPWMNGFEAGEVFKLNISSSEGRIILTEEKYKELCEKGQIAGQYVDSEGNPTMDSVNNPLESMYAIESLTSADGKILGKMTHPERYEEGILKNIPGNKDQNIFQNAVDFFRK